MPTIRSVSQEQIVYHPNEVHPEYRVVVSLDGSPFAVERYAGTDAAGARRWEPLAEISPRSGGITYVTHGAQSITGIGAVLAGLAEQVVLGRIAAKTAAAVETLDRAGARIDFNQAPDLTDSKPTKSGIWSDEDKDASERMYEAGRSLQDIGLAVGRSADAVGSSLRRRGILR